MQIGYRHPDAKAYKGATVAARVGMLLFAVLGLGGMVIVFTQMAGPQGPKPWKWALEDIRRNFIPVLSVDEQNAAFEKARGEYLKSTPFDTMKVPVKQPDAPRDSGKDVPLPFDGGEKQPDLPPPVERPVVSDQWADRAAEETALLKNFKNERWLDPIAEFGKMADYTELRDWHPEFRGSVMSEFQANRGRQAPPYEQLAFNLLKRVPAAGAGDFAAWEARAEKDAYFFGLTRDFIAAARGRVFEVQGRLYDFYEVKCNPPAVLADGTKVEHYYEGVVVFLRPGKLKNEFPIEQQAVLFQTPDLPHDLEAFLGAADGVSHDDKLVTQDVQVKLTGMFLRDFPYSREVKPFSGKEKVTSQAWCPLLLTRDVRKVEASSLQATDQLLQQVKDSLREEPRYLVDEAAYYVLLSHAMRPDDKLEVAPKVGYFDLSGMETGPRYRGQGVGVRGIIGDNYAPVILPPNISGLRRVFRVYMVADMMDIKSPNRYLVDMIEPPTGLEARASVTFSGRYYRNVFEAESTATPVRPLLIARQVARFSTKDSSQDWIFMAVILGGAFVIITAFSIAMFNERRERSRFENLTMAAARQRLEKHGGLKLKPLPRDDKPGGSAPPAPPESSTPASN
ncbi:MAG: hypothetical protein IT462_08025 [Planctomycetes bacterium]|nr:hypothetical protein [Planctomycetota bacterium]